ncbi:MAG: hypothetical protein RBU37_10570 [Myxococcota bacterium]|jgi:Spy/CpxP family protein refolding chaperone|nr:hypothetical protein [Myxococcota bacterium]
MKTTPRRPSLRITLAFSLLLLLIGSASVGCRRQHDIDPDEAYRFVSWRVDDKLDELDATPDQRSKIHEIKDQLFDLGIAIRDDGRSLRQSLVAELSSDSPDAKLMHQEVDAFFDKAREAAHAAVDASVEVHQLLDASQRQTLLKQYQDRNNRE